jgi:hypothetical protein
MRGTAALRFALCGGASSALAALVLLPLALSCGEVVLRSGLAGWLATTLAGVGGGAWLVSQHGRGGPLFLAALGACMLLRLLLFVGGPLAAAPQGADAVWAVLVGLFAGYLPVQVSEVLWFLRS